MPNEIDTQSSQEKQPDVDILDVIGVLFLHFLQQAFTKINAFIKKKNTPPEQL